jgi:uncharacterized membrane-anchored protein YjiN (DUF445 family)
MLSGLFFTLVGNKLRMSDTDTQRPTINQQVAERIKTCAPDVEQRLVDHLVEKEVSRRVEVIGQALAKLDTMDRDRRKLAKPTTQSFNLDGSIASESYTKEALEALKKHDEKRSKLQRATDKALNGDLGDLGSLINEKN